MKLPSVIVSGLLAILLFGLQWILGHIGEFSIAPQYLAIVTGLLGVAIAAVAKMLQERAPEATARELAEPRPGYWHRVIGFSKRGWSWSG